MTTSWADQEDRIWAENFSDDYDSEIQELAAEGNYDPNDPDDYSKLERMARGY